jgi:hypothetical protein
MRRLLALVALLGACDKKEEPLACGLENIPEPIAYTEYLQIQTASATYDITKIDPINPTWYGGVQLIVRDKCWQCHRNPPRYGAPVPLVTYDDTQSLKGTRPYSEVMLERITADFNAMPPANQPQLSDLETTLIERWVANGSPAGTGTTAPPLPEDPDPVPMPTKRPISKIVDVFTNEPYPLPVMETNYVCFAFTIPELEEGEMAFRYEPIIDNEEHLHHMILGITTTAVAPDGVPYPCPENASETLTGWSAGTVPDETPPGVGVPLTAGKRLFIQKHFNNVTREGLTDFSGYRVYFSNEECLTPAGIFWTGVVWHGEINGTSEVLQSSCIVEEEIIAFGTHPHMHAQGTSIALEVRRKGELAWTPLMNVPNWASLEQPNMPVDVDKQRLMPGDELRTTCVYNTGGRSVPYGLGAKEEMCFVFVFHYPSVQFQYFCVAAQDRR